MASWKEIERIRKDAVGFRALAARMLAHTAPDALTEWEVAYLADVGVKSVNTIEFTTRQAEKLLEIRDNTQLVEKIGRDFSVSKLIEGCYLARDDLTEDQEEWIAALRANGANAIRRRDAGKLLRCAYALNLIEDREAVSA